MTASRDQPLFELSRNVSSPEGEALRDDTNTCVATRRQLYLNLSI